MAEFTQIYYICSSGMPWEIANISAFYLGRSIQAGPGGLFKLHGIWNGVGYSWPHIAELELIL